MEENTERQDEVNWEESKQEHLEGKVLLLSFAIHVLHFILCEEMTQIEATNLS